MLYSLLSFLIPTIGCLFGSAFLLRVYLQKARIWYQDPIVRFSMALTDWWTLKVRRYTPTWRGIDWASVLGAFFCAFVVAFILDTYRWMFMNVATTGLNLILGMLVATIGFVIRWSLMNIGFFAFLLCLLSWVRVPMVDQLIGRLLEPFLRPIRKFVRPKHGLDLSVFILLLVVSSLWIVNDYAIEWLRVQILMSGVVRIPI